MAFTEMEYSSGDLRRTPLWENQDTSSSFSGQTVTVSSNIDVFDYIEVEWQYSTTSTSATTHMLINVQDFIALGDKDTTGLNKYSIMCKSSSFTIVRSIARQSTTSIYFGEATKAGATGTSNTNLIPVKVNGVMV